MTSKGFRYGHQRFHRPRSRRRPVRSDSAGSASRGEFPCSDGRANAERGALRLEIHRQDRSEARQSVELERVQRPTEDQDDPRHSLRHVLVQAGYRLEGVLIEDILADAGLDRPTDFVLAHCYDNYSTNVPLADLLSGKAMVALNYAGKPLPRDHGGPARLLVPHLYFWKSAKWVNALQFTTRDEAGFWELRGYHIYGDPWREQRYTND